MSYILEALKKAQAERQLGETPTIHAPTLDVPAEQGGTGRKPLAWLVLAMGAVIAVLAVVVWRQSAPSGEPAGAAGSHVPATVPAAAAPAVVAAVPATPAPAVMPPPVGEAPPPAARAPRAAADTPPAVVAAKAPAAERSAPAPAAVKAEEPAREEPVQAFRELPEPIQRAIPTIAMTGYMYSPNPADRLILIDKVLRREGDEVAPGVVLVRLEPKGAVFTFRGYRYRMPY